MPRPTTDMRGTPLSVGDRVAYCNGKRFYIGTVTTFNSSTISVTRVPLFNADWSHDKIARFPSQILKLGPSND